MAAAEEHFKHFDSKFIPTEYWEKDKSGNSVKVLFERECMKKSKHKNACLYGLIYDTTCPRLKRGLPCVRRKFGRRDHVNEPMAPKDLKAAADKVGLVQVLIPK